MMVEALRLMEQLGHAHVFDAIQFHMHVCNRKIICLFEIWIFWVGQALETTNQVEVAQLTSEKSFAGAQL